MTEPADTGVGTDPGAMIAAAMNGDSSSSPVDTPQSQDSQQQSSATGTADNPAWAPFLAGVPQAYHPGMKNHLRQWDDNYRGLETRYKELEGKYEPYKAYEGVDPRFIGYGMNFVRAMNQNPLGVYNMLKEHVSQLGLLSQQTPESNEGTAQDEKDPWQIQLEQRQAELDQRQAAQDQWIQEQQYNATVQQYQSQIDEQIQGLIAKYGEKAVDIEDVLTRMFNQASQGQQINAEAAYEAQKTFFQRMYGQLYGQGNGRPAPNVIPPSGQIAPSEQKPVAQMNDEERQAYLARMIAFANQSA